MEPLEFVRVSFGTSKPGGERVWEVYTVLEFCALRIIKKVPIDSDTWRLCNSILDEHDWLNSFVKLHKISQPLCRDHSDPEIYGSSESEAMDMRLRYVRALKRSKQQEVNGWLHLFIKTKSWLAQNYYLEAVKHLDKLTKDIYWIKNRKNSKVQPFDIPALKSIPLDRIIPINRSGFFKLRDEKTPSAHWNKVKNTWTDFGSGEYGDSIDLIMKIKECDFVRACAFLRDFL